MPSFETVTFYSSKPRLVHLAVNIAISPLLLYLFGIWPWPPSVVHLAVFAISGIIAFRFAAQRWQIPRLIMNEDGLHCNGSYARENILKVEPFMRSLKLTLREGADGKSGEKVVSLGWASNADQQVIIATAVERFGSAGK